MSRNIEKIKKLVRTMQTYWPTLGDVNYSIRANYRKILREPFDNDFAALKYFCPSKDTVFLDIGANRGQSIMAMRLFHRDVPIIAFEPRSETFNRLQLNTADVDNVRLIHGGLSDESGRFTLYTPVYRDYVFDGLASTIRSEAEEWLNANKLYFFDRTKLDIQEEDVMLSTLDSYNFHPSFMKLDVQGAEERVLRGGVNTIATHAPIILVEQSPDSTVEAILAPLGYAAYAFKQNALCLGAAGRKNAFYIPRARKADLAMPVE
jgi:FkbM family methyltransferase